MTEEEPRRRVTDPVLLVEVALGLLLLGLFFALYFIPAEESFAGLEWWSGLLLGGLFFGLVGLDAWRRKRRNRQALRQVLREQRQPDDTQPMR